MKHSAISSTDQIKNSVDSLKFRFNIERFYKPKIGTKITQNLAERDKDRKSMVEILRQKYIDYHYMKIKEMIYQELKSKIQTI